jgi:hypothetical protein
MKKLIFTQLSLLSLLLVSACGGGDLSPFTISFELVDTNKLFLSPLDSESKDCFSQNDGSSQWTPATKSNELSVGGLHFSEVLLNSYGASFRAYFKTSLQSALQNDKTLQDDLIKIKEIKAKMAEELRGYTFQYSSVLKNKNGTLRSFVLIRNKNDVAAAQAFSSKQLELFSAITKGQIQVIEYFVKASADGISQNEKDTLETMNAGLAAAEKTNRDSIKTINDTLVASVVTAKPWEAMEAKERAEEARKEKEKDARAAQTAKSKTKFIK